MKPRGGGGGFRGGGRGKFGGGGKKPGGFRAGGGGGRFRGGEGGGRSGEGASRGAESRGGGFRGRGGESRGAGEGFRGGESRGGGGFRGRGGESRGGGGGFRGRGGESRGGEGGGFRGRGGESRGGEGGGFRGRGGESRGGEGGGFRGRGGESRGGAGGGFRGPGGESRGGEGGFRGKGRFDRAGGGGAGFRGKSGGKFSKPGFRTERPAEHRTFGEGLAAEFREETEIAAASATSRFIFGVNPALEALRARPEEIERLYYAEGSMNPSVAGEILSRARDAGVRTDQVPRERLNALAEGGVHQGLVLEMREFKYAELDELTKEPGLVVVLDSLQDPQNVGAIIRSANAFGAKGIVLAKDRAAAITGSVVKASAGATEHTRIVRVTNLSRALEELKAAGYWTVAADPEGDPLGSKKLDGPLAVVIGAEGPGVRQGVLSHCDFKVRIPMLGQVASLNASVSAGIILYEIVRQRTAATAATK